MTAGAVRVMVHDVWDTVTVPLAEGLTFAQLKARALAAATVGRPAHEYVLKLRGVEILDETVTLAAAQVPPDAPFIVLAARRRPVR